MHIFSLLSIIEEKKMSSDRIKKRYWQQKNKKENRVERHVQSFSEWHTAVIMCLGLTDTSETWKLRTCDGDSAKAQLHQPYWTTT